MVISATCLARFSTAWVLLALGCSHALAAEPNLKLEVQLVWATNDRQSPDPKHKPVAPEVLKKLKDLPLKWSNYFEVNRRSFQVPSTGTTNVPVSDKCSITVKRLSGSTLQLSYIGKGNTVETRIFALPRGDILAYGGNAPNATAWFVVLKRME